MPFGFCVEDEGMNAASRHKARREHLSGALRGLRKERGVSQSTVASAIGVDVKTIQRIEGGALLPNVSMIFDLSDYFEIPVGALLEDRAPGSAASPRVSAAPESLDHRLTAIETRTEDVDRMKADIDQLYNMVRAMAETRVEQIHEEIAKERPTRKRASGQ